jgi:hypothetical protein
MSLLFFYIKTNCYLHDMINEDIRKKFKVKTFFSTKNFFNSNLFLIFAVSKKNINNQNSDHYEESNEHHHHCNQQSNYSI